LRNALFSGSQSLGFNPGLKSSWVVVVELSRDFNWSFSSVFIGNDVRGFYIKAKLGMCFLEKLVLGLDIGLLLDLACVRAVF